MSDYIYRERHSMCSPTFRAWFGLSFLENRLSYTYWGTASVILIGEPNPSPKSQTTYIQRDTLICSPTFRAWIGLSFLGNCLSYSYWGTTSVILTDSMYRDYILEYLFHYICSLTFRALIGFPRKESPKP